MGLSGKLFRPKEIPKEYVNALYSAYKWGFTDKEKNLEMKSLEDVRASLTKGFKEGLKMREG